MNRISIKESRNNQIKGIVNLYLSQSPNAKAKIIRILDESYPYFSADLDEWRFVVENIPVIEYDSNLMVYLLNQFGRFDGQLKRDCLDLIKLYVNRVAYTLQYRKCTIGTKEEFYTRVLYPIMGAILIHENTEDIDPYLYRCTLMGILDINPTEYAQDVAECVMRQKYPNLKYDTNFDDSCYPFSYYNEVKMLEIRIAALRDEQNLILFIQHTIDIWTSYTDTKISGIRELYQNLFLAEDEYTLDDIILDISYAFIWYYMKSTEDVSGSDALQMTSDALQRAFDSLNDIYSGPDKLRDSYIRSLMWKLHASIFIKEENRDRSAIDARLNSILHRTVNYRTIRENPFIAEEEPPDIETATEAYDQRSKKLHSAQSSIYRAFKNYKNNAEKVGSQVDKMCEAAKRLVTGDIRTEIIEGKKFSAIGLLKKALGTAAIFAFGPIKGLCVLVVRYALKKSTSLSERRKILLELQVELDMINEKIEDAKSDGNRQAKYAMMRTKAEIEAAIGKIKYGIEIDEKNIAGAKDALSKRIGGRK